jgi:hypothetical protein
VPISAVDAINPAFEHTKQQLFRPFGLGQWTRLAFVGLLAGEMGAGAGGGGPHFNVPASGGHVQDLGRIPHIDPAILIPLIIVLVIAVPVLWFLFLYLSSRMRFVLFDSIVAKRCELRRMWTARGGPALQLFLWQIVFSLSAFAALAIVVGVPALGALALGWFSHPHEHMVALILTGLGVLVAVMSSFVLIACTHVFTKDFVVPQMALENISAFEGWRRFLPMLARDKGGYAGYVAVKVALALGAAIIVAIVVVTLALLLLIPIGGIGIASVLFGKAAGLTLSWGVLTITAIVVLACLFVFLVFYGAALVSVPVIVFFPAYAIYFFASRYQLLAQVLYPPPPIYPTPLPQSPA